MQTLQPLSSSAAMSRPVFNRHAAESAFIESKPTSMVSFEETLERSLRDSTLAVLEQLWRRKAELRAEVDGIRARILENRTELAVHTFAAGLDRAGSLRKPTSFAHRCRRPPPMRVLGVQLGPWDGTCYKEKLLRSLSVRLHLKLCFAALKLHRGMTRAMERVVDGGLAMRQRGIKRLCFQRLVNELLHAKEVIRRSELKASAFIASRRLLPAIQMLSNRAATASAQRNACRVGARAFCQRLMRTALGQLAKFVAVRRRFGPSRYPEGDQSEATDASVTSDDSLNPLTRANRESPARRRRVGFDMPDDRTDTSSSSGRRLDLTPSSLSDMVKLLRGRRFESSRFQADATKPRTPYEMNVSRNCVCLTNSHHH